MKKNYTQRLEKLKKRRLDETLQRYVLSRSFSDVSIGESIKYALESMSEIDPNYTKNTFIASENIRNNLTTGLKKKNIEVEYRHQGSIETNTHIKLHSDVDILVFTDKYFSLEPPLTPASPYNGDPLEDLKELRNESFLILDGIYNQVDNSKPKSIKVYPTSPKRKVDVVICNWVRTEASNASGQEKDAAIHIYNKSNHTRQKDFPFLHIYNINRKDNLVNGGLKKLIRLLKTLKVDAEYSIDLSSFEISSIVYGMDDFSLRKSPQQQLLLLNEASKQLDKLITDRNYRENLLSPNGKENVFGIGESKIVELKKLKLELDELIEDITEELGKKYKKIDESLVYG